MHVTFTTETPITVRRNRAAVGVASACLGAIVGAATAVPQVPVDTGQVLAGIVELPETSPSLAYHVRAWCVLNQVSALALRLGSTERAVDFALSAAVGLVWFLAISWTVLGFGRSATAAVAAPLLIFAMLPYKGIGPAYPVVLVGTQHTYGTFGSAFALLILATHAVGLGRASALFAGLAPAVHVSVCGAVVLSMGVGAALRRLTERRGGFLFPAWKCFAAGATASVVLCVIHFAAAPDVESDSGKGHEDLTRAMMVHWDEHRTPPRRGELGFLLLPMAALATSLALAATSLRRRLAPRCRSVAWTLAVVVAGSLAGLWLQAAVRDLPMFLAATIPGRFANVAATTGLPVALGLFVLAARRSWLPLAAGTVAFLLPNRMAAHYDLRLWRLVLVAPAVELCATCVSAARGRSRARWLRTVPAPAGLAACALVLGVGALRDVGLLGAAGAVLSGVATWIAFPIRRGACGSSTSGRLIVALLLVAGAGCAATPVLRDWDAFCRRYVDYRSDPFWQAVHARGGPYLQLPGQDHQRQTARPPVLDGIPLDAYLYARAGLAEYRRLWLVAYDIDVAAPPPGFDEPRTNVATAARHAAETWKARSGTDWRRVGRELGFRDVLAPPGLDLQLRVVASSEHGTLYEVPSSDDQPSLEPPSSR